MRIGSVSGGGRRLTDAELAELRQREQRLQRISALSQALREEAPQEIYQSHSVRPAGSELVLGSARITEFQRACLDPNLALRDSEDSELVEARGWASQTRMREVDERVDLACGLSLHAERRQGLAAKAITLKQTGSPDVLLDLGEGYLCAPGMSYDGRKQNLAVGQYSGLGQEIDPGDGTIFLSVYRQARESSSCRLNRPMPEVLGRLTFHDGAEFEQRRWQHDASRALHDTYVIRPDGSVEGYEFRQIGDSWKGGHVEVVEVGGKLEADGRVVTESGHEITPWVTHQQLFGPRRVSPELETYYSGPEGTRKVMLQEGPRYELGGSTGGGLEDAAGYVQLPGVRLRKRS